MGPLGGRASSSWSTRLTSRSSRSPPAGPGSRRSWSRARRIRFPQDVSPDGQWLLYLQEMENLGILPLARPSERRLLRRSEGVQGFGRSAGRAIRRVPVQRVRAGRDLREAGLRHRPQPARVESGRAAAAVDEERGGVLLAGRPALRRPGEDHAGPPGRRAPRALPHRARGEPAHSSKATTTSPPTASPSTSRAPPTCCGRGRSASSWTGRPGSRRSSQAGAATDRRAPRHECRPQPAVETVRDPLTRQISPTGKLQPGRGIITPFPRCRVVAEVE